MQIAGQPPEPTKLPNAWICANPPPPFMASTVQITANSCSKEGMRFRPPRSWLNESCIGHPQYFDLVALMMVSSRTNRWLHPVKPNFWCVFSRVFPSWFAWTSWFAREAQTTCEGGHQSQWGLTWFAGQAAERQRPLRSTWIMMVLSEPCEKLGSKEIEEMW